MIFWVSSLSKHEWQQYSKQNTPFTCKECQINDSACAKLCLLFKITILESIHVVRNIFFTPIKLHRQGCPILFSILDNSVEFLWTQLLAPSVYTALCLGHLGFGKCLGARSSVATQLTIIKIIFFSNVWYKKFEYVSGHMIFFKMTNDISHDHTIIRVLVACRLFFVSKQMMISNKDYVPQMPLQLMLTSLPDHPELCNYDFLPVMWPEINVCVVK